MMMVFAVDINLETSLKQTILLDSPEDSRKTNTFSNEVQTTLKEEL